MVEGVQRIHGAAIDIHALESAAILYDAACRLPERTSPAKGGDREIVKRDL